MKWIALLLFILVGVGVTLAIQRDRRAVTAVAFLLGFLPFVMDPWHLIVSPYAIPAWPGYVKGWQFSLIDAIAAGCLIGLPRARSTLPFKYVFLFYVAAAVLSACLAPNFKIAAAYPIQLARVFIVFAAVARLSSSPAGLKATMQGLFVGLAYQAAVALVARFGGAIQTGGSFGHQNLLGFVSHLVFLPAFALLLSGRQTRLAVVGLAAGAIVVTLTVSRATIVFAAIGLAMTYLLSVTLRWSPRKGIVALSSLLLVGLSLPIIASVFEQRFETKGGSFTNPDEERLAFARAARMMIADYPFGVGANHYVLIANTQGYSQRAGVIWNTGSRSTNVHNSYLLIHAETGFLGLLAMVSLLGTAIVTMLRQAFRHRRLPEAELLIGFTGAILAVVMHSFYEWVLVTYQAQYVLAVSLGTAAGVIVGLKKQSNNKHGKLVSRLR